MKNLTVGAKVIVIDQNRPVHGVIKRVSKWAAGDGLPFIDEAAFLVEAKEWGSVKYWMSARFIEVDGEGGL